MPMMAAFGYIVYIVICALASILWLGVMTWPGEGIGEKWFVTITTGFLWYGAYQWAPFTMVFS